MLHSESMFYNDELLLEKVNIKDSHNQTAIHIRELTNELKDLKDKDGNEVFRRKDKVFQAINEFNKFSTQIWDGELMIVQTNMVMMLIELIFFLMRIIIIKCETLNELKQAKNALVSLKKAKVRKQDQEKINKKIKALEELIQKMEEDHKNGLDIDYRNKHNISNRDKLAADSRKSKKKRIKGMFL